MAINDNFDNGGEALPQELPQIIEALEAVYNPHSTNELRQSASLFLEHAKQSEGALAHGFSLASDSSKDSILRHFGLSMMIFNLKYVYHGGNEDTLRQYVLHLAQGLNAQDPPFLRNKVAQIWSEVAKRIWGRHWIDMDEQLAKLWEMSFIHQELVLIILETLSEDVFNQEDYAAGLRQDLGSALARICVTAAVVEEQYSQPDAFLQLRYGQEGWLQRLGDYLKWCLDRIEQHGDQIQSCIIKTLTTLGSICSWITLKSLQSNSQSHPCVEHICYALVVGNTSIRTAAMETLNAIFGRVNINAADMVPLLSLLFSQTSLQLLQEAYRWADVNPSDIDEGRYTFLKRQSELLACLGTWAESQPSVLKESGNLSSFFSLFLEATKHPSLTVSSPLLQVWLRILRSRSADFSGVVQDSMGALLELSSQRSVRYDSLPEGSTDPTLLFLIEDCDTIPQRDLLLQQYRTGCVGVVELIVRRVPLDAIRHILGEAASFFQSLQNQPFLIQNYTKVSPSALQADAHFTVVDAGTRGCLKFIAGHVDTNPEKNNDDEQKENDLREVFAQWCQTALSIHIDDPDIKRKMITQVVSITCKILVKRETAGFLTLESLLSIRSRKEPASQQYTDTVKELLDTCAYGAQKLATVFADQFLTIYDQLEQKIQEIVGIEGPDLQPRYAAFLVMIIHRSSNLDTAMRTEKLRRMILPVKEAWEDATLAQAVSDYSSFCSFIGWDRLPEFLAVSKFEQVEDWAAQPLDESGRSFQADLLGRNDRLPIKLTKALLHATTEKLEEGSSIHGIACTVWGEVMSSILPCLLKMLSNATTFHNPEQWAGLPEGLQLVVKRMLTDRFWQNGISAESRDAFVNKVNNSKHTYEGFGSTIRRTVRQVRVGCCDIILLFSKLGSVFYGIPDLPGPLSQALFESSQSLSAHHFSILVTFSSQLISGCPADLRAQFLPPLLTKLFFQLVYKVDSEWESVNKRTAQAGVDDNLDEEMKNQSILRSMTYNGCYLIFNLLDQYRRENPDKTEAASQSVYWLILTDNSILEPVLLFAKSALGVRDTHSVTCMLTTLRDIIPRFNEPSPVRTFICDDLLKAAITSLHEPYFVDQQKELATLIVHIILLDGDTAASVIGSLPGLSQQPQKVQTAIERVQTCPSDRVGRALVLELLEQIRGVSIHEMGRIGGPKRSKTRAKLLEQYDMAVEKEAKIERGGSPGLEGVARLLQ